MGAVSDGVNTNGKFRQVIRIPAIAGTATSVKVFRISGDFNTQCVQFLNAAQHAVDLVTRFWLFPDYNGSSCRVRIFRRHRTACICPFGFTAASGIGHTPVSITSRPSAA